MAEKTKALALTDRQQKIVNAPTPKQYIKNRQGPGGKIVNYVEIGYVIKKLNEAFSPFGWDFEIKENKEEGKSIFVLGSITIKDHQGHQVTKQQYGNADKKENVPVGDIYKAAGSDALKKCASLLGLALDVYAPDLENTEENSKIPKAKQVGVDPNDWKPMYKGRGYPTNSKMKASPNQIKFIREALSRIDIEPKNALFKLKNRVDGKVHDKTIDMLDKGDACDIIQTILKFGKDGFLEIVAKIVKEIPKGEPPEENDENITGEEPNPEDNPDESEI